MTKAKVTLAALAVAGVVGLGFAVPALAQDDGATKSPSPTTRQELRAEHESDLAERLAKKLGLDTQKVEDALRAVREEMRAERQAEWTKALKQRLDQAVKDGKLTREQADAILEATEKGVLPGGPGRGGWRHWHGGFGRFGPGSPSVPESPLSPSTPATPSTPSTPSPSSPSTL